MHYHCKLKKIIDIPLTNSKNEIQIVTKRQYILCAPIEKDVPPVREVEWFKKCKILQVLE